VRRTSEPGNALRPAVDRPASAVLTHSVHWLAGDGTGHPQWADTATKLVFLFDVDNTLLDNDAVQADLSAHLQREFGHASRDRYWAISRSCARSSGTPTIWELCSAIAWRTSTIRSCCGCRSFWWITRSPTGSIRVRGRRWRAARASEPPHPLRRRRGLPAAQGAARRPVGRVEGRVLINLHKEQMWKPSSGLSRRSLRHGR